MSDAPKPTPIGQVVEFKTDGPATVAPPNGALSVPLAVVDGTATFVLTGPGEYVFDLGTGKSAEQHIITAR